MECIIVLCWFWSEADIGNGGGCLLPCPLSAVSSACFLSALAYDNDFFFYLLLSDESAHQVGIEAPLSGILPVGKFSLSDAIDLLVSSTSTRPAHPTQPTSRLRGFLSPSICRIRRHEPLQRIIRGWVSVSLLCEMRISHWGHCTVKIRCFDTAVDNLRWFNVCSELATWFGNYLNCVSSCIIYCTILSSSRLDF